MQKGMKQVLGGILLAALLWFFMFSPWTSPLVGNFWLVMAFSAVLLTVYAIESGPEWKEDVHMSVSEVLLGCGIAVLFWGVFWVGDKLSQMLFSFARGEVDMIYTLKGGANPVMIAFLLLLVIGPAEEIFWRGFVEKRLISRLGKWGGWAVATAVYALVHIWSMNFMLVMAALVIGALWGFIYMMWPRHLGAIIVSHALWDVAAFVVFPF